MGRQVECDRADAKVAGILSRDTSPVQQTQQKGLYLLR